MLRVLSQVRALSSRRNAQPRPGLPQQILHRPLRLSLFGESLWLLPERVILWEERRTLLVADPHWGKAAAFRASGANILSSVMAQGAVSDPFDKMLSFMVVWLILGSLPARLKTR